MIDFAEARHLVSQHCPRLPKISIPTEQAFGFVLAEPLVARRPLPRFDSSAVDGYAVRSADIAAASRETSVMLALQGAVRAGDVRRLKLKQGQSIRILTGAIVPAGADALVMQEHVQIEQERVIFSAPVSPRNNIRFRGEEFRKGEMILESGALIAPPVVAMLATLGQDRVRVYRKPRVALVVTGDELRTPGIHLRQGQIYDSNTPGLVAALEAAGIDKIDKFRVGDNPKRIEQTFRRALAHADVVISSGGVSVGSSDFVKDILGKLKVRNVFWRVAIKPGKPIYFGRRGKTVVFGLPGNPVAALVGFQILIKPALLRMMGAESTDLLTLTACLTHDLKKKPGRMEFVRGILTHDAEGKLHVRPTRGQDSHMMGGLATANCLIQFPKDADRLSAGSDVTVSLLHWSAQ
ncbi:MAG: molybdopterin molybdotransferase MoeA [Bacteroidetes bacterium]|nr:molybdopterin molybdotransferase MoeA [Bacteroidota bacterium]